MQEKRQAKKLQRLKEKELRLKEKELRKKDKSKAKKKSKADDKARDTEKDKDAKEAEVGGSADAPPPDDGDEQAPQASAAHMDARRKAARLIRGAHPHLACTLPYWSRTHAHTHTLCMHR